MTMNMTQDSETQVVHLKRICIDKECALIPLRTCPRCNLMYCPHYASKIDFQFCTYCFHDLILEDSIIRRIEETKSLSGKKIFYSYYESETSYV